VVWWGAFKNRVADCCTFSLRTLLFLCCWDQIFSAGTRKNGKFWVDLGKNGKFWSFSVKLNGQFWPFGVPGKVASPKNYFDRIGGYHEKELVELNTMGAN
jgi:hypothetical protein